MSPIRRKRRPSAEMPPTPEAPKPTLPEGYADSIATAAAERRAEEIERLKQEKPWLEGVSPDGLSYDDAVAVAGDAKKVQNAVCYAIDNGSGELLLPTGAKLFFQKDGNKIEISLFGYAADGSDLKPYAAYLPEDRQAA